MWDTAATANSPSSSLLACKDFKKNSTEYHYALCGVELWYILNGYDCVSTGVL